jgi:hypothetical protein
MDEARITGFTIVENTATAILVANPRRPGVKQQQAFLSVP